MIILIPTVIIHTVASIYTYSIRSLSLCTKNFSDNKKIIINHQTIAISYSLQKSDVYSFHLLMSLVAEPW
jgi:hypothetical protein